MTIAPPLTIESLAGSVTAPTSGAELGGGGMSASQALAGLDKYRGKSQFRIYTDSNGAIRVENKSGEVVFSVPSERLEGIDKEELQKELAGYLGNGVDGIVGIRPDGSLYVNTSGSGAQGDVPSDVTPHPSTSAGSTQGGGNAGPSTGGSGNQGNAGGAGGGGSGSSGSSSGGSGGGFDVPDISPGGSSSSSEGGITLGGGGGGPAPIDPNVPLGLDFPGGARGAIDPGTLYNDPSAFNTPRSFTEGLDRNSTLNDILLGAMGEQRATRDAALGIQGGLARNFEESALRQANEGNALSLAANPFSITDSIREDMLAGIHDRRASQGEQLQQAQAARAASQGISRSGVNAAQQDRIDINTMRDIGNADRDLRIEQATRRPQELARAIGTGNDTLQQQQAARERIAGGAVGILEGTDITADAALLGTLGQGGTPTINIARGPTSGPISGIAYSGPANLNPYR